MAALGTGLARFYLAAHFLHDILVGAILGWFLSILLFGRLKTGRVLLAGLLSLAAVFDPLVYAAFSFVFVWWAWGRLARSQTQRCDFFAGPILKSDFIWAFGSLLSLGLWFLVSDFFLKSGGEALYQIFGIGLKYAGFALILRLGAYLANSQRKGRVHV